MRLRLTVACLSIATTSTFACRSSNNEAHDAGPKTNAADAADATDSADVSQALFFTVSASESGIFQVPTDGSEPQIQLTPAEDALNYVGPIIKLSGSNKIAYFAFSESFGRRLFITSLEEGTQTEIADLVVPFVHPLMPKINEYYEHRIVVDSTSDESRFVYAQGEQSNLFSVREDGTQAFSLQSPSIGTGTISFEMIPGKSRVAYLSKREEGNLYDLYTVNTDGSQHAKLNADGESIYTFSSHPKGDWIAYPASTGLTLAKIDGSERMLLEGPSDQALVHFEWSPDGEHIAAIFRKIGEMDKNQLYSIRLSDSRISKLSLDTHEVLDFKMDQHGNVVFRGIDSQTRAINLFANRIDGFSVAEISVSSGGFVDEYKTTNDGSHVVYIRKDTNLAEGVLAVTKIDGKEAKSLFSGNGNDLHSFEMTDNGQSVVHQGDANNLYATALDGTGFKVISVDLPENRKTTFFQITPDGQRVVYRADKEIKDVFELYSSRLNGSDQRKLNKPLSPGENISYSVVVY